MCSKKISAGFLALAVGISPVTEAAAGNDGIVGGIIGGIIGGAIANSQSRHTTTRRTTRRTGASRATRAANREIQNSLNYFGFPAGTPDGALGRKSRAAISQYQAFMGYGVTGKLSLYERDFLVNSFNRAQSGGYATQQLIDEQGQGTRGLLIAYREEQTGGGNNFAGAGGGSLGGLPPAVSASVREIAKSSDPTAMQLIQRAGFVQLADMNADGRTDYILDTSVTGSAFWCNADNCAVRIFLSTPKGYQRNDFQAFNVVPAMFNCHGDTCAKVDAPTTQMVTAPVTPPAQTLPQTTQVVGQPVPTAIPSVRTASTDAAAAPLSALPNFMANDSVQASLASHCNQVSLITSSNGGFATNAAMSDPNFILEEQFCLARTYAISEGEDMARKLVGVTNTQLEQQCDAFGPAMKDQIAALSLKPYDQVTKEVETFVISTGMAPAQLSGTAKVCLSVGYRTDNMDVVLGSAMLLTVLGQTAYAELLGHHLTQGFGVTKRPDLGKGWYQAGFDALSGGALAVFAPGNPERTALIHEAVFQPAPTGVQGFDFGAEEDAQPVSTLPTFSFGTASE